MSKRIRQNLEIPIIDEVDVLVVGGGPAGIGASIAAARNGANTLLVEQYVFLGGMWTAGLVNPIFDVELKGGIIEELISRLKDLNAWGGWNNICFDYETMKFLLDQIMEESGVKLLLHTFAVDVLMEEEKVKGVVVENKSGRSAIIAKVIVDCTGDGDIAAKAGCPYEYGRKGDSMVQPMTLMFRLGNVSFKQQNAEHLYQLIEDAIRKGADYKVNFTRPWILNLPEEGDAVVQMVHIRNLSPLDAFDLTKAELEARKLVMEAYNLFKNWIPELKDVRLIQTGIHIGIRESRRIIGEYMLTEADLERGASFPDGILRASFPIDIHDPTGLGQIGRKVSIYEIPYRCLLPLKVEQLLVAGRCISGTHVAHASYRVTGNCIAMGQAAGTAAAISIFDKVSPRNININLLRETLRQQGVKI